jgi:hypothetical protein
MLKLKIAATAGSILALAAAATPAAAGPTYYVTNVSLDNGFNVSVNGGPSELAGAIGLTLQGDPDTVWVWCVDLDHVIDLGAQKPALAYAVSPVTTDSTGATSGTGNPLPLVPNVAGEIATLADIGTGIAKADGSPDDLSAIQGAIWSIEYDEPVTSGNMADDALIAGYISYAEAHPQAGDPHGFYPLGAMGQGFGTSQGFSLGVPEPATWTMMVLGLGGLGAMMRTRRRPAMAA